MMGMDIRIRIVNLGFKDGGKNFQIGKGPSGFVSEVLMKL